jgi:hypothetical protein
MKRLLGLVYLFALLLGVALAMPNLLEAAPTLTIDGISAGTLAQTTCPTGYNSCWLIPGTIGTGRQIGNWMVADVSSTNRARVLINDVGTVGSVDALKLTGVTLTPIVVSGTKTATVVIRNQYTAGQPKGDYKWAMGMGGYFDPPTTENVVGDRLRLLGTGDFLGSVTMGTLDTGSFTTSTILNVNGSVTRSLSAITVKPACDTGGGFCRPTIAYTFTITANGQDKLVLNDSVIGAGGTCREEGSPSDVPPGTPDPLPPVPTCKAVENQVNQVIHKDMLDSIKSAKAAGAVVAETCVGACGNGTIIIQKAVATGDPDGTFGFHGTGEDMPTAFDITTTSGAGSRTFSNVATGLTGGQRTIEEIVFPDETGTGAAWILDSVTCTNTGGANSTAWSSIFDDGEALTGVTVSNLADADTLTCIFTNERFFID